MAAKLSDNGRKGVFSRGWRLGSETDEETKPVSLDVIFIDIGGSLVDNLNT
jgi:hypothetical protein